MGGQGVGKEGGTKGKLIPELADNRALLREALVGPQGTAASLETTEQHGKAPGAGCMKPSFSRGGGLTFTSSPSLGAAGLSHQATAHIYGAPGRVKEMVDGVVRSVALCSLGACSVGVPRGQAQEERYKASVPAQGAAAASARTSLKACERPVPWCRRPKTWGEGAGRSFCTTLPEPPPAEGQRQLVRELANFRPQRSSQTLVGCPSRPCGSVRISPLLQGPFLLGTGLSFFTTQLDLAHSPRLLCAAFLLPAHICSSP